MAPWPWSKRKEPNEVERALADLERYTDEHRLEMELVTFETNREIAERRATAATLKALPPEPAPPVRDASALTMNGTLADSHSHPPEQTHQEPSAVTLAYRPTACAVCGGPLPMGPRKFYYCSHKCRQQAYRDRKAGKEGAPRFRSR